MATQHTSLAVKYRPQKFEDVCGQDTVKQILKHQIDTKTFRQAYLMAGHFGTGKTTVARIFARMVNACNNDIIEIDAATYNSVDQIRVIADEARKKPLVGKYKIFVLDEVHMLSSAASNAFLKILEEPPATAMFLLCTTDPQKLLSTILSRVQRYDFTSVPIKLVIERLRYIARAENIVIDDPSIEYIAKLSGGGMRDAISMLDKVSSLNSNITIDQVASALSVVSYSHHLALLKALIDKDTESAVKIVYNVSDSGSDMRKFMSQFMWTVCDVCNYFIFKSFEYINIPELDEYKQQMNNMNMTDCLTILNWSKQLCADIRNDADPKDNILVSIMLFTNRR